MYYQSWKPPEDVKSSQDQLKDLNSSQGLPGREKYHPKDYLEEIKSSCELVGIDKIRPICRA